MSRHRLMAKSYPVAYLVTIALGLLYALYAQFCRRPSNLATRKDLRGVEVLGCMVVNRADLTLNMLRSIDYPVHRLVLIHNADSHTATNAEVDDLMDRAQKGTLELGHDYIRTVITHHHPQNLGFSAGVNQIVTLTPDAPYWLIANNDILFNPGSLREIALKMANKKTTWSQTCLWGMAGDQLSQYSLFVITPRALQTVGFFDENFWPAYGEDCDYTMRLLKASCHMVYEQNSTRMARHIGSASWKTTKDKSNLATHVGRSGPTFNNFDYLKAKWGADVCGSRKTEPPYMERIGHSTPFGVASATLATWSIDATRREKLGGPKECLMCSSDNATDPNKSD